MKVLFLDIDGVLNWVGAEDRIGGYIGLCPERIARFNRIFDAHPDTKIVISSTWRRSGIPGVYDDVPGLIKLLQSRGIKGKFIGITPFRFGYQPRGNEIREWIDDNEKKLGITQFVILDDDTHGMEGYIHDRYDGTKFGEDVYTEVTYRELRGNHVVTHWDGDPNIDGEEGGLQDKHIDLAIKILNGELLPTPPLKKDSYR